MHDRCTPNEAEHQDPKPCTSVDMAGGYAILKDKRGASQFLLLPTARVSGIEDRALLAPGSPAYWEDAWQARHLVQEKLAHPLPASELSLAVNSPFGRSQDQLHIHIDCVVPELPALLAAQADKIDEHWSRFPATLNGHVYRIRRVKSLGSGAQDPFRLVSTSVGGSAAEMARESILVVGIGTSDTATGFYILETQAHFLAGNMGSAEELQDHDCTLARQQ